eukprot:124604_1
MTTLLQTIIFIHAIQLLGAEDIKCGEPAKTYHNNDGPKEYNFVANANTHVVWFEGCPTRDLDCSTTQCSDIWFQLKKNNNLIASCDDCQQIQSGSCDDETEECHECNTVNSYWGSGYQQAYGDLQYVNTNGFTSDTYTLVVNKYSSISGQFSVKVYCNEPKTIMCDGYNENMYFGGITRRQRDMVGVVGDGAERDYYRIVNGINDPDESEGSVSITVYLEWTDNTISLYKVNSDGSRGSALTKGANTLTNGDYIEVDGPASSSGLVNGHYYSYYRALNWQICCTPNKVGASCPLTITGGHVSAEQISPKAIEAENLE